MARRSVSMDEKVEKAKESVDRTKAKYDAAVEELEKLMVKKEEMKKDELMSAIMNSSKSYDEVMKFLKDAL